MPSLSLLPTTIYWRHSTATTRAESPPCPAERGRRSAKTKTLPISLPARHRGPTRAEGEVSPRAPNQPPKHHERRGDSTPVTDALAADRLRRYRLVVASLEPEQGARSMTDAMVNVSIAVCDHFDGRLIVGNRQALAVL